MGVQEVRWRAVALHQQGNTHFFYGKGNKNQELDIGYFVHIKSYRHLRRSNVLVLGCHA
jgi:hypothetical protein